jgi:hypothetical protein
MLFKIAGWTFFSLSVFVAMVEMFGVTNHEDKVITGIQCLYSIAQAAFFWYVLMVL